MVEARDGEMRTLDTGPLRAAVRQSLRGRIVQRSLRNQDRRLRQPFGDVVGGGRVAEVHDQRHRIRPHEGPPGRGLQAREVKQIDGIGNEERVETGVAESLRQAAEPLRKHSIYLTGTSRMLTARGTAAA